MKNKSLLKIEFLLKLKLKSNIEFSFQKRARKMLIKSKPRNSMMRLMQRKSKLEILPAIYVS